MQGVKFSKGNKNCTVILNRADEVMNNAKEREFRIWEESERKKNFNKVYNRKSQRKIVSLKQN